MGNYIAKSDLENAMSPATVLAIYNDQQDRTVSMVALNAVIDRAESMVDSYLVGENVLPMATPVLQAGSVQPPTGQKPVDRQLRTAALQYAVAYSYQRHAEYAKLYGVTIKDLIASADAMMLRMQAGEQELPDTTQQNPAGNEGGIVVNDAQLMFIDNMGDL